jgi:phenylacetate-CoA ligase
MGFVAVSLPVIRKGYPPFVKDVVDDAAQEQIDMKALNIRLMFAAEVFTEPFRDYLAEKVGIQNVYTDTLNIYGTADIGAMAWETGVSVLLKRLLLKDKKLYKAFFGKLNRMPTIAQYNPHFITFEAVNEEILLTGNSALPLVRYALGDHGGVISFKEMKTTLAQHGYNLEQEAKKAGLSGKLYELPFVYVYERNDFSTTLYGLQIYPEVIREVLTKKSIAGYVTGKFTMLTKFDSSHDQYLEINIELKKNAKEDKVVYDPVYQPEYWLAALVFVARKQLMNRKRKELKILLLLRISFSLLSS